MFAPWRSQKSLRKHKEPITGNYFILIDPYVTRPGSRLVGGITPTIEFLSLAIDRYFSTND